jgi:hypothetical protein
MSIYALLPPLSPFLFSALVVSGLASKALHIALHIRSLPFLYFVLYSPTLILPDVFVIILARVLLRFPAPEGRWQCVSTALGGALSYVDPAQKKSPVCCPKSQELTIRQSNHMGCILHPVRILHADRRRGRLGSWR